MGCEKPLTESDIIADYEDILLEEMADLRAEKGMPPVTQTNDTMAAIKIGDELVATGTNGSKYDKPLDPKDYEITMNAITRTHAEGQAILRLVDSLGKEQLEGASIRLVVDRTPCLHNCQKAFPKLAAVHLKLSRLEVVGPNFHAFYGQDVIGEPVGQNEYHALYIKR